MKTEFDDMEFTMIKKDGQREESRMISPGKVWAMKTVQLSCLR